MSKVNLALTDVDVLCAAISSTSMADISQESLPTAARHGARRVHLICTRQHRIVGVLRCVPLYILLSLGTEAFAGCDGRPTGAKSVPNTSFRLRTAVTINLAKYRSPVLNVRGALSWMSNVAPRQSTYNPTSSPVFYPYLYLGCLVVALLAIGCERSHS